MSTEEEINVPKGEGKDGDSTKSPRSPETNGAKGGGDSPPTSQRAKSPRSPLKEEMESIDGLRRKKSPQSHEAKGKGDQVSPPPRRAKSPRSPASKSKGDDGDVPLPLRRTKSPRSPRSPSDQSSAKRKLKKTTSPSPTDAHLERAKSPSKKKNRRKELTKEPVHSDEALTQIKKRRERHRSATDPKMVQAFMASSEFAKSKKRSGLGEPSSSLSRGGNGESSGAGGRKKKRNKASALKKQTPPVNNAVDPNRAIYVDVIIREAKQINTSVADGSSRTPSWNEDFTFTSENELDELKIELLYKAKGKTDALHGYVSIALGELRADEEYDLWRDLVPPSSCDIRGITTGSILFTVKKVYDESNGMLAHYGRPLKDIPLRMDAGDLVLVSNVDLITHAVKLGTRSNWDHVAMVVKMKGRKNLRLFEATKDGVETYMLNSHLVAYRAHAKVGIRRLLLFQNIRSPAMIDTLYKFVDELLGRPYKKDWMQLVRAAYGGNETEDLSSLFCSQLIAAAYQRLGLLPQDTLSNNFVPSDFGTDLCHRLSEGKCQLEEVRKIRRERLRKTAKIRPLSAINDAFLDSPPLEGRLKMANISETVTKKDEKMRPYTGYMMEVFTELNIKWLILKRFNDFVRFDKQLRSIFQGLPRLPPKSMTKNSMSSTVVQQRKTALQEYMRDILRPPLRDCALVAEFLTIGRKGVKKMENAPVAQLPSSENVRRSSFANSKKSLSMRSADALDASRSATTQRENLLVSRFRRTSGSANVLVLLYTPTLPLQQQEQSPRERLKHHGGKSTPNIIPHVSRGDRRVRSSFEKSQWVRATVDDTVSAEASRRRNSSANSITAMQPQRSLLSCSPTLDCLAQSAPPVSAIPSSFDRSPIEDLSPPSPTLPLARMNSSSSRLALGAMRTQTANASTSPSRNGNNSASNTGRHRLAEVKHNSGNEVYPLMHFSSSRDPSREKDSQSASSASHTSDTPSVSGEGRQRIRINTLKPEQWLRTVISFDSKGVKDILAQGEEEDHSSSSASEYDDGRSSGASRSEYRAQRRRSLRLTKRLQRMGASNDAIHRVLTDKALPVLDESKGGGAAAASTGWNPVVKKAYSSELIPGRNAMATSPPSSFLAASRMSHASQGDLDDDDDDDDSSMTGTGSETEDEEEAEDNVLMALRRTPFRSSRQRHKSTEEEEDSRCLESVFSL